MKFSKPDTGKNKKIISICCLLKILPECKAYIYIYTVKPVLVVTSIKQPTCIKQPEESCPKIHGHIFELY